MGGARFIVVHRLKARAPTLRTHVTMACGRVGHDQGCNEFTTHNGVESRMNYTEVEKDVTCKACLRHKLSG